MTGTKKKLVLIADKNIAGNKFPIENCPICGFELYPNAVDDVKKSIGLVLDKFSKQEQVSIQELWIAMKKSNQGDLRNFLDYLIKLRKFNEDKIVRGIRSFLRRNMHKRGRGFAYCLAISRNWGQDNSYQQKRREKDGNIPKLTLPRRSSTRKSKPKDS